VAQIPTAEHPDQCPQAIPPDPAAALRPAALAAVDGDRRQTDAAAAGHDPSHQQRPWHVITARHQQGMADVGALQVIHQ